MTHVQETSSEPCPHVDVRYSASDEGAVACYVCGRLFGHLREGGLFVAFNPGIAVEALCETCNGQGRIDLNAGWHGPHGVERHHWHQCPDCDTPVRAL